MQIQPGTISPVIKSLILFLVWERGEEHLHKEKFMPCFQAESRRAGSSSYVYYFLIAFRSK